MWQRKPSRELSPLAEVALVNLEGRIGNSKHNGFHSEPEKRWTIEHLRWLWFEGEDAFDPAAIEAWALERGWPAKEARRLRGYAEGVRNPRRRFLSGGRLVVHDPERGKRAVEAWRRGGGRVAGYGEGRGLGFGRQPLGSQHSSWKNPPIPSTHLSPSSESGHSSFTAWCTPRSSGSTLFALTRVDASVASPLLARLLGAPRPAGVRRRPEPARSTV
jgi:hypothetical protein